jgi:protein-L-isoaspartate(D-aspartate) O-methyltransferase
MLLRVLRVSVAKQAVAWAASDGGACVDAPWDEDIDFAALRAEMVRKDIAARGIVDERVLDAMRRVPRERFVWQVDRSQACTDHPIRIGEGQTISQPYIVALMSQELGLTGEEKVLELGTGSGYQTAILADLARAVYTVERFESLSERARGLLSDLGYAGINYRVGDGTFGWPEEGPFDAIIVTAGAPRVPEALKEQLADGGRLIIPVGGEGYQDLMLVTREGESFAERVVCGCSFVKLVGAEGWSV